MHIESRPTPLTPLAAAASPTAENPASGFQDILARLHPTAPADTRPASTEAEPPPLYLSLRPALDDAEDGLRLQKTALDEEILAEEKEALQQEEQALELEWREEELEAHYEEQLWEEALPGDEPAAQDQEPSDPAQEQGSENQAGGEGGDDGEGGDGEIVSDHEEFSLPALSEQGTESGGSRKGWASACDPAEGPAERKLNYEEIQHLVNTLLNSQHRLPHQVRHILQDLLNGMLDGQRRLLDQHRLSGLEAEEYQLLLNLFPPHFYAGWLRQERQRGQELPLYQIIQDLFVQQAPDARRKEDLLILLGYSFDPLPLPLRNWVLDHPPLLDDRELINLLEVWQQQQALPPGAIGQILNLAQTYQHHPETMRALFSLSQTCLHRRPLAPTQIELLAQKLYERCFPPLADESQTLAVLKQVLQGHEPSHESLMRLLLGSAQAVLSYLPYACLAPSLQEIQDYVRRDLLGQEEQLPELFREDFQANMA